MNSTPKPFLDPVSALYREPHRASHLSETEWDQVIRLARQGGVSGQLCSQLQAADVAQSIPARVYKHLLNAKLLSKRHRTAMDHELKLLAASVAALETPVILLKGGAYLALDLAAADGRWFGDIDLLVPKAKLQAFEQHLYMAGWIPTHMNAYDQHYYRQWMHEIPPMEHIKRGTLLDLHHHVVPPTAGLHCDSSNLIAASIRLTNPSWSGLSVLAPTDMVLHSATHLFMNEMTRALRELIDLDRLLRHFSVQPHFWRDLLARAQALDLQRPLFYALRHTQRRLGTPIPEEVQNAIEPPNLLLRCASDAIFDRVFQPDHSLCNRGMTPFARWLTYARSHWLRMPLYLLLPHLIYKAVQGQISRMAPKSKKISI